MHKVEIDHDAIQACFARYAGEGPEPGPSEETQGEYIPHDEPGEWMEVSEIAVSFVASRYVPAWNVTEEHRKGVSENVSMILNRWFPGGPPNFDKWGPYAQLVFSVGVCAVMDGFDWETFTIKPRHDEPEQDQQDRPTAQPQQSSGGKFTTAVEGDE